MALRFLAPILALVLLLPSDSFGLRPLSPLQSPVSAGMEGSLLSGMEENRTMQVEFEMTFDLHMFPSQVLVEQVSRLRSAYGNRLSVLLGNKRTGKFSVVGPEGDVWRLGLNRGETALLRVRGPFGIPMLGEAAGLLTDLLAGIGEVERYADPEDMGRALSRMEKAFGDRLRVLIARFPDWRPRVWIVEQSQLLRETDRLKKEFGDGIVRVKVAGFQFVRTKESSAQGWAEVERLLEVLKQSKQMPFFFVLQPYESPRNSYGLLIQSFTETKTFSLREAVAGDRRRVLLEVWRFSIEKGVPLIFADRQGSIVSFEWFPEFESFVNGQDPIPERIKIQFDPTLEAYRFGFPDKPEFLSPVLTSGLEEPLQLPGIRSGGLRFLSFDPVRFLVDREA